jgi:hypothetical protein
LSQSNNYLSGNYINVPASVLSIQDQGLNTRYTDKAKITLQKAPITSAAAYNLTASPPRSYVSFAPVGAATILTLANGKAAGDLLILENTKAASTITLSEGATVNLGQPSRILGQYDTLWLIWNGSKWLEVKYVDN